jgi:hypothetical protein
MRTVEQDKTLTRYLLGKLSEQERIEVEDRYISDGEFFDELAVAEDELIDAYVRAKLSANERQLFEQNFLSSPARQQRVKSARALMRFADTHAATARVSFWQRFRSVFSLDSPAMGLALATGFMMLVVGGALLVIQMSNLRSDLKGLQSEQLAQNDKTEELKQSLAQQKQQNQALNESLARERAERGQLEQEVARLREQQQQQAPPVVALGFGGIRSGTGSLTEATRLTVPAGAETVKLQLDLLKDEYQNYLVVVEDAQQREIWRSWLQSTKVAKGKAVVVRMPSRIFTTGQYKLTLSGSRNNKDYEVISEFNVDVTRN